jgi:hypothetical protein
LISNASATNVNVASINARDYLIQPAIPIDQLEPQIPAIIYSQRGRAAKLTKTNLFDKFYEQSLIFDPQTSDPNFFPEASFLGLMDLSNINSESMMEMLDARRVEASIDNELIRSLFDMMEKNSENAKYINNLESQTIEEIDAAENLLNTMTSFDSMIESTRMALRVGINSRRLYDNFENQINSYIVKFAKSEQLLSSFDQNFVKLFESINAMGAADAVDPQFLVWKNLKSIVDMLRHGVSNRYLLEQSKKGIALEYMNFDYDGTLVSFEQFDNFYLNGFDPLERIFYYISCMNVELNSSIGMGKLQSTANDGDDWLKSNVGLNDNWLQKNEGVGFYSSVFLKSGNAENPLLRLGLNGAFDQQLRDFKRNARTNTYQNYDNALQQAESKFDSLQQDFLKLTNVASNKRNLLTNSKFFKRILESFNSFIGDLNQNINNNEQLQYKVLSLALLSETAGAVTGMTLKLKHALFSLMLKSLRSIREERASNDIKLFVPDTIDFNFSDFSNQIQNLIIDNSDESIFEINENIFEDFIRSLQNSNLNQSIIFHKMIQIFLELEKECIDQVNQSNFKVEFLKNNGRSKFSNLDASKFLFMIYEIFCILTQVFLKTFISKKTTRLRNPTNPQNPTIVHRYFLKWSISSDEVQKALKLIPRCLENNNFEEFFNSFQTFTINDNIGFNNHVYGGMVTAQNFYELSESFKKEESALIYHLASIKTVLNNFRQSTAIFNEYTKVLRNDPSIQDSRLTNEQKSLKNFLNTELGKSFFDDLNKLKIARARLRLRKLRSLSKPFDLAAMQPQIYDAIELYVKNNDYFEKNKLMFIASIDQGSLKEMVTIDFNKRLNMNLKITKINEFKDLCYQPKNLITLPLGFCLSKDLLYETIVEAESKGLNILSTMNDLVTNANFFDLSNARVVSQINSPATVASSDSLKKSLIESYLACSLIEVIAKIDLDLPGTFKNDVGYNLEITKNILNMAGEVLQINSAFDKICKITNNSLQIKNREEVLKEFGDQFDFSKVDLMHSLLDCLLLRRGKLQEMIFKDGDMAQVFAIAFDPDDFVYEDGFDVNDDNEVRFDSLYLETEFS